MIVLFLIATLAGLTGGWLAYKRWGNRVMTEENKFYREHISTLKDTLEFWKQQYNHNKEIENTTIKNHNLNLKDTLNNIVNILQKENKESLKEGEKDQIETIIKTIKSGNHLGNSSS